MSKKTISVSIIGIMLAASFVITGMTVGRSKPSKPKYAAGSSQKKVVRPDPPGTIDGAIDPELIPDHVSYTLVFRTIATRQGTDFEKARSRAWANRIGFDAAAADKLIESGNEFEARVSTLDRQAKEIKDRTWPNPGPETIAELTNLQRSKEALVAEIIASLHARLGQEMAAKLHQHVTEHLKRKMKVASVSTNPYTALMQTSLIQVRQQGFEAGFQYSFPKSFYNGRSVGGSDYRGKLYVDRFGREREEIYVRHNHDWELTFIELWDPVGLKSFTLIPAEKKILTQQPIDPKTVQRTFGLSLSGVMTLALPRHSPPEGKRLGDRQIEGLTCKGVMITSPGDKERPSFAAECWYSEAISYVVFAKAVFGETTVENTFRLSNIQLIESDQELFVVPADYQAAKLVPVKN